MNVYELAQRHRAALAAREHRAASEMVDAYGRAWTAIKERLDLLNGQIQAARDAGEKVDSAWLMQRGRLKAIKQDVEDELRRFADYADQSIRMSQAEALRAAGVDARQLVNADLGPIAERAARRGFPLTPWNSMSPQAVENIVGFMGDGAPVMKSLIELATDAGVVVARRLVAGIAVGLGPRTVGRQIRSDLGMPLARALTIARTETFRAYREATRESFAANSDVVKAWRWQASFSLRTCAMCLEMSGKEFPTSEMLGTHPNCFVADTMIAAPGIVGVTSRWFEGEIVEVKTRRGNLLAVTPNHPILTAKGWIAAGLLDVSDSLIGCADAQRALAAIDPDNQHVPARIQDVVESFARSRRMAAKTVPVAPVDFHGDGSGSKVAIVWADSLLRHRDDVSGGQPFGNHLLVPRSIGTDPLAPESSSAEVLIGVAASSDGGVRRAGVRAVLLGRTTGHHQPVGVRYTPNTHAAEQERALHGSSADAVAPRDRILGDAGLIESDDVVEVGRREFRGHVYNLQTRTGWYIANGIIAHNCRCVMVPVTKSWEELGFGKGIAEEAPPPNGDDWLREQPVEKQISILGAAKQKAWADGEITLGDLVGYRDDPQWGPTRWEKSLKDARASQ